VAFRLILAVPHFIVLYALGIAASVVVIIGWFGALATGRLPGFAAAYLSGYLRWYCRTAAYLLLLTDEYPPFALDDTAYPVRVAVGHGRLGRLAVLFRVILAIPAAIASMLLVYGVLSIVIVIAWLTALVAGKLPASLHQAFAAVLRYIIRYYAYLYLLTDAYPAGLFGDQPGSQAPAEPLPNGPGYGTPGPGLGPSAAGYSRPGYGTPGPGFGPSAAGYGAPGYGTPDPGFGPSAAGYGAPGYGAPDYGAPDYGLPDYGAPGYGAPVARYGTPAPGYGTPAFGYGAPDHGPSGYGTPPVPGYGAPAAVAPGQDASWQLVLPPGAKRVVRLILVLGLLAVFGEGFAIGTTINAAVTRDREINQLNAEITQHNAAVARLDAAVARQQAAFRQATNAQTRVSDAHDSLASVLNSPAADSTNCATVTCFDTTSVPVANAFAAFGRTLRATAIPPASAAVAKRLSTDTAGNEKDWKELTQATSFTSIEDIATAAETVGGRYDNDYQALVQSLGQVQSTLENQATTLDSQATALNNQAANLNRRAVTLNAAVNVRTASEA
jgi:prefoldin subunit 5